MSKVNAVPTAEVIAKAAKFLRESADRLDFTAKQMTEKNDLSYAIEAIVEIANITPNLRLDLLVSKPIRELNQK